MINLRLSISNPWATENFKNLFNRSGLISEHKAWEFEICRHSDEIVKFSFHWSVRTDHAGPNIELSLFGYNMSVMIYDTRHWDHKNRCWESTDQ